MLACESTVQQMVCNLMVMTKCLLLDNLSAGGDSCQIRFGRVGRAPSAPTCEDSTCTKVCTTYNHPLVCTSISLPITCKTWGVGPLSEEWIHSRSLQRHGATPTGRGSLGADSSHMLVRPSTIVFNTIICYPTTRPINGAGCAEHNLARPPIFAYLIQQVCADSSSSGALDTRAGPNHKSEDLDSTRWETLNSKGLSSHCRLIRRLHKTSSSATG